MKLYVTLFTLHLFISSCGGGGAPNQPTPPDLSTPELLRGIGSASGSLVNIELADGRSIAVSIEEISEAGILTFAENVDVNNNSGQMIGVTLQDSSFLALAAINDQGIYTAIGGHAVAPPQVGGILLLSGPLSIATHDYTTLSKMNLSVDLGQGTFTGGGGDFQLSGDIIGEDFIGTSEYMGQPGDIDMSFYASEESDIFNVNGISVGEDGTFAAIFSTQSIDPPAQDKYPVPETNSIAYRDKIVR